MTKSYHSDFIEAMAELLRTVQERDELETKIAKQKKRVAALFELISEDSESAVNASFVEGITDAVRTVLRAAEKGLQPIEIRDRIQGLGLPAQTNLLASVHTVLKRLKDSGEAAEIWQRLDTGMKVGLYVWAGKSTTLDAMEKALFAANFPKNVAAERAGLVAQIKAIKERNQKLADSENVLAHTVARLSDVPNPLGKNLMEMLKQPQKKK